jgi:hypothetical protein
MDTDKEGGWDDEVQNVVSAILQIRVLSSGIRENL